MNPVGPLKTTATGRRTFCSSPAELGLGPEALQGVIEWHVSHISLRLTGVEKKIERHAPASRKSLGDQETAESMVTVTAPMASSRNGMRKEG